MMSRDDPDPIDTRDSTTGENRSEEDQPQWDADDPRRQHDQMAPPREPCECYCLHCQRTFMSDGMWFQKVLGDVQGFEGFWMCPTPNWSGAGFTFDIFPTDPDHPANAGWWDDDEEDYDEEDDEFDEAEAIANAPEEQYDPGEAKYKRLDEQGGDDEEFVEGDEWKYGLSPGEAPPPQMFWSESARKEWEEEQKRYDAPDERPRELDWSDRKDRDGFNADDIPF